MSKAKLLAALDRLDLAAVKKLLAARPALRDATDRQGRNLMHLACKPDPKAIGVAATKQIRLVEWLLEQGFDIDEPYGRDRCTPLFEAVARARNPRLVKYLIDRGASVAAAPGYGLFAAGWWDDVRSLELLLDAGADIDVVVGVTPFLAAWGWRKFAAAKYLARRGADVNFRDPKGRTALAIGRQRKFDAAQLRWLERSGATR